MGYLVTVFLLIGSIFLGIFSVIVFWILRWPRHLLYWIFAINLLGYPACYSFVILNKWLGYRDWIYANYSYVLANAFFLLVYIVIFLINASKRKRHTKHHRFELD